MDLPPLSFYFQLKVESDKVAFQEASGINTQTEHMQVEEGNENRFRHKVPDRAKYDDLVLKRGMLKKDSAIFAWIHELMPGDISRPILPKNILLELVDANGKSMMSWTFYQAYPVKWTIAEMNAISSEIAVEEVAFAYTYFTVNQP